MRPKLVAIVFFCLLFSACSTKMAYNYLDWILEWYVGDLVTLDYEQEWQLRNAIARELNWHRKKQLPLYIKGLDDLNQAINNGLTVETLQQIYTDQEKGLTDLILQITPAMSQLLATFSDEQAKQLLENLQEQNLDLEEEYVDKPSEELNKQRIERMIDRAENWIGPLTDSQIKLITEWSPQIRPTATQWISNRRAWQARLGSILREKRFESDFDEHVEELFVNSSKAWPDSYHVDFEYNKHLVFSLIVSLEKNLSTKQRQHLFDEIAVLRRQLTELHNQQ